MKGIQKVRVTNNRTRFDFELTRNITIVRGDSGTGKSTLYDMVAAHTRLGGRSGVQIVCEKKCVALTDLDWRNQLNHISDSIVFVDEGFEEVATKEFASAIKVTDNYYVFFVRENLKELPYSIEEIYEIRTSGKRYHKFAKMYKHKEGYV